jgi:TRAP-type C4-dicarboxylate transport system substrate-binding protein
MITRRQFVGTTILGGAVAATGLGSRPARSAEFVFKWGCGLPASHPGIIRGVEAAEIIKRESNGRLEVQIFADNQLGSDSDMLAQVRAGGIQMYTPGATTIAPLVPVVGIINMAFAFKDGAGRRAGRARARGDLESAAACIR